MTKPTITTISERLNTVRDQVDEHDRLLVRGKTDGEPAIMERLRILEDVVGEAKYWLRAIGMLFLTQFVTVIAALVWMFVNVYPILIQLDRSDVQELVRMLGGR